MRSELVKAFTVLL